MHMDPCYFLFIEIRHTEDQLIHEFLRQAGKVRRRIVLHDTQIHDTQILVNVEKTAVRGHCRPCGIS